MSNLNMQATKSLVQPRRANDVVTRSNRNAAQPLFDEFWRDGELAMLFGEPGVGKSVLAVQVADSLARGRPNKGLDTLKTPTGQKERRKVLYIDLVLSDKQFGSRYGGYKFSANLYRDSPSEGEDLFEWVRAMAAEFGFSTVVIDDLSPVSRTEDGTRETLRLMRALRRLTVETGVSILVLADSYPFVYDHDTPERGLRRSRALCGVADSVFTLRAGEDEETRELLQTRSRAAELKWTAANPLWCTINKLDDGLLGITIEMPEKDEEGEETSDERREQILDVKAMHDEDKMTFRRIATELGITKSTAQRLYAEWRPEMEEGGQESEEGSQQQAEEECRPADSDNLDVWVKSGGKISYDYDKKRWIKVEQNSEDPIAKSSAFSELKEVAGDHVSSEYFGDSKLPDISDDSANFPESLDRSTDPYGHEIFVESWDEHRQKPLIWYKRTRTGYNRHKREPSGIDLKHVKLAGYRVLT